MTVDKPTRKRRSRKVAIFEPITRSTYITIAIVMFVVLLGVWSIITALGLVQPMFLPSPLKVLGTLGEQAANGELWTDIGVSTYRILVGYLIATAMSVPIGILMGTSTRANAALEPFFDFLRYMPVVAFIPLTILWAGTGDGQKFLIIWMGTFFQQVLMVSDAVRTVPRNYVNLGATLGMGTGSILTRIVLPSAMPRIWDALRISLGWAWTWLVVAELVAASSGLGYRITVAQRYLATDTIFGYVIVLGILGLVSDQIMRALARIMFRYQKGRS